MKLVVAAGGTAGHINPALSFVEKILQEEPDSEVIYVGREDGMEYRLVKDAGIRFYPIDIHGFKRSLSFSGIAYNIRTVYCLLKSSIQCRAFLKKEKPDLVVGFGGYVSGPVVREATSLGIHTAIHEQNSFPGVTSRLLSKKVDHIFAANQDAADKIGYPDKTTVVGNPVSNKVLEADREEARTKLGIGDGQTCILSFGGSLGSSTINQVMVNVFSRAYGDDSLFFLHATGEIDTTGFWDGLKKFDLSTSDFSCRVSQYIDDMADCLAAADLVVCRSGAITISELAAVGRASYLIPSPYVAENHQYYNAMTLGNLGAAVVEEEKDMDFQKTAEKILQLAHDKESLKTMGELAKRIAVRDSASQMYHEVLALMD
ncbi:MAG: undecaprenyldiphospho-muramoylpentapeptide beta-N-acetylglucosaminyltransferase [Oscillospiraceae bacterium]|nr:undecaprenyldiphospho-muramoylpentapeptide beta-N-acetylglucosaminyltransferase [Oscillospiraceae bacterium]MBR0451844.1 undecaprenyldiphospho-muramoylpentapeptide beta-N-acetylglucosaminyltransferase [Oscillospiraceae bacterium]